MARRNLCLFLVMALLGLSYISNAAVANSTNHTTAEVPNRKPKHYCVAALNAPLNKLHDFMSQVCKAFNCSAVERNGPCYKPVNLVSHSSYMLNVVYKKTKQCLPGIGARTSIDHSYEKCHYL